MATVKVAKSPFNQAKDDTVLITSADNVRFYVRRGIIAEASHVFELMFGAPRPEGLPEDKEPIRVAENTRTLDLLLRFCYPLEDPRLATIAETVRVLEATKKYMMVEVEKRVKKALLGFAPKAPLRLWAVLYARGMLKEARAVVPHLVGKTFTYVEELAEVDAAAYCCLLRACGGDGGDDERLASLESTWEAWKKPEALTQGAYPASDEKRSTSTGRIEHGFTKAAMVGADLIIRSSDGEMFFVDRVILTRASSVFETLLKRQVSNTVEDGEDSLVTLPVKEHSWTVSRLLRFMYPQGNPPLESLDILEPTLRAAAKYRLGFVVDIAQRLLEEHLTVDRAGADPHRVYAIGMGCELGLQFGALAAYLCLQRDCPTSDQSTIPKAFSTMSAKYLHRLLLYRNQCSRVARGVLTDLSWLSVYVPKEYVKGRSESKEARKWEWFDCSSCTMSKDFELVLKGGRKYKCARWWVARVLLPLIEAAERSPGAFLDAVPPDPAAYMKPGCGMCHACRTTETICGRMVAQQVSAFWYMSAKRIRDEVAEVKFEEDS